VSVVVEICVQGLESGLAAEEGGADRIELCDDLAVGGVTPGVGVVADACRRLSIPIHVLVRPRGGDFVYSEAEFEVMRDEIRTARSLGAAGVVLGILNADGTVDRERNARLIDAAGPLNVTFHKAFDEVRDPFGALDELIGLGVERVLTSGLAPSASEGLGLLVALARKADGRVVVMPGGRITEGDLPVLIDSGFNELHIGSAACSGGRTDAGKVRRIVDVARSHGG
jgi:copper homeostasis protein